MPNGSRYENIREAIHPELARLSDARLESILERNSIDAEAMEGWLSTLGNIGKAVLPAVGGLAGTFIGGPAGAAIGGQLGQLAGGALAGATGASSPPPRPVAAVAQAASGLMGSPSAGRLLQTVTRPETMQALMSMFMGGMGNPNVQVGGTSVPVGAFTNLLGTLANQAASEHSAALHARELHPEYMSDYAGELRGDPAVAEHRAEALYELLERTPLESESLESSESAEFAEYRHEMEAQHEYELMDFAELLEGVE